MLGLAQRREIVRLVADVRVRSTGMSGGAARWHGPPIHERVVWRWRLGPGADAGPAAEAG